MEYPLGSGLSVETEMLRWRKGSLGRKAGKGQRVKEMGRLGELWG